MISYFWTSWYRKSFINLLKFLWLQWLHWLANIDTNLFKIFKKWLCFVTYFAETCFKPLKGGLRRTCPFVCSCNWEGEKKQNLAQNESANALLLLHNCIIVQHSVPEKIKLGIYIFIPFLLAILLSSDITHVLTLYLDWTWIAV